MTGPKPRPERPCRKCGRILPTERFRRYPSGGISTDCMDCVTPRTQRRGKGPWKGKQPCKQCGQEFYAEGYYSHVQSLVTCSAKCLEALRRVNQRQCNRCKRTLPVEHFDHEAWTLYGRRATQRACRKCRADSDAMDGMNVRPRPTFYQLWVTARERARAHGQAFELKRSQARAMHRAPCDLCGRAVSSLLLKSASLPWRADNIRMVCRRCNKLQKVYAFEQLLLWAHEVVSRNPLVPEDVSDGQKPKPNQGRAFAQQDAAHAKTAPRVYALGGRGRR